MYLYTPPFFCIHMSASALLGVNPINLNTSENL
jgi:hypothetical protein